MIRLTSKVKQ